MCKFCSFARVFFSAHNIANKPEFKLNFFALNSAEAEEEAPKKEIRFRNYLPRDKELKVRATGNALLFHQFENVRVHFCVFIHFIFDEGCAIYAFGIPSSFFPTENNDYIYKIFRHWVSRCMAVFFCYTLLSSSDSFAVLSLPFFYQRVCNRWF